MDCSWQEIKRLAAYAVKCHQAAASAVRRISVRCTVTQTGQATEETGGISIRFISIVTRPGSHGNRLASAPLHPFVHVGHVAPIRSQHGKINVDNFSTTPLKLILKWHCSALQQEI
jgi:hypothetical protein